MERTVTISRTVPDDEDDGEMFGSTLKAFLERFKLGVDASRTVMPLFWLFTREGTIELFDAAEMDG